MSFAEVPSVAACPACIATPLAVERAQGTAATADQEFQLSLPTVHCAACISAIENGLMATDGVADVRVNLTRKRATVKVSAEITVEEIVDRIASFGYQASPLDMATLSAGESDRATRDLAMRLGVSGFAMMNVMLLSVAVWSGATDATRDLFHWISAGIALPTIVFAAQPFFKSAWAVLKVGRLNMDVPISLAILLASAMSVFETMSSGDHAYFDAALSLTFFLLAGRYLDQRMRGVARSAATELAAMEAPMALRLKDGHAETVALKFVAVGDVLLVQPGSRVPVDGTIIKGATELDRAFLTGETDLVPAQQGDFIRAGEVNLTGAIEVRADAVGEDTLLHGLADLVAVAEQAKSRYNSLADRAARIYAPLVHMLALVAFALWLWISHGDVRLALNVAVAVLIITCPCALGLAVPAVSTVASGRLFKSGLLVKHASALERLAEADHVVFDKTGTLTLGQPSFQNAQGLSKESLAILNSLAQSSAHPRSKAIVEVTRDLSLPLVTLSNITELPGQGVEGQWEELTVRLGRASWVTGNPVSNGTLFMVEGREPVALSFCDELRPGAKELTADLRARGVPMTLLSGDAEQVVAELARDLGIENYQAEMMPDEKVSAIQSLQSNGAKVLMIGDGLNDTAALASAHVSAAPASALEATRVAADFVLVSQDLANIGHAMRLSKSATKRILENFGVAAVYNLIAVPIAFFGFATPLAAAIAMSTSSIIVSLNALRVR